YRVNNKDLLETKTSIYENVKFFIHGLSPSNQRGNQKILKKRKYRRIKDDNWLKPIRMALEIDLPRSSCYRYELENDTIRTRYIDSTRLSQELAIYSSYARMDRFTLFHLKNNKEDSTYSTLKYETLYNYLLSLEKVGNLEGNPAYKTFTYSVTHVSLTANYLSKEEQKPYLYLTFCPQFGIVEYHYLKPNIHIRLITIDGKPLQEYVKKGLCITPFCEIK
ncbi:MAG: hypothetical protein ACKVTZ_15610, partial [Bacteroidia bacterium]